MLDDNYSDGIMYCAYIDMIVCHGRHCEECTRELNDFAVVLQRISPLVQPSEHITLIHYHLKY